MFLKFFLEVVEEFEELLVEYDETAPARQQSEEWWQIYEPTYAEEFHSTEFVTSQTIEFIENEHETPWLA